MIKFERRWNETTPTGGLFAFQFWSEEAVRAFIGRVGELM